MERCMKGKSFESPTTNPLYTSWLSDATVAWKNLESNIFPSKVYLSNPESLQNPPSSASYWSTGMCTSLRFASYYVPLEILLGNISLDCKREGYSRRIKKPPSWKPSAVSEHCNKLQTCGANHLIYVIATMNSELLKLLRSPIDLFITLNFHKNSFLECACVSFGHSHDQWNLVWP